MRKERGGREKRKEEGKEGEREEEGQPEQKAPWTRDLMAEGQEDNDGEGGGVEAL